MVIENRGVLDGLVETFPFLRRVVLVSDTYLDQNIAWDKVDRLIVVSNASQVRGYIGRPQQDRLTVFEVIPSVVGADLRQVDEVVDISLGARNISICIMTDGVWYLT